MTVTALVLLIPAGPIVAQTGLRVDILTNGGFEDGLTGWQPGPGHQLIEDPKAARAGDRCLFGEVTEENQAHILRREVELRPDKLYEFEMWARATNRTKLVLWRITAGERSMVQAWQRMPNQWRRHNVMFGVEAAGTTMLEIVAPSSYAAPVGKMWIDDIALYEYDLPPAIEVSGGDGFNDFPSMVCANDGAVWFAWVSFREGADTLQVARAAVEGDKLTISRTWQAEGGRDVYILDPTLATDGDRVWLAYSAEKAGNWDVYAAQLRADGPAGAIRITQHPAVDRNPALAVGEKTVSIAWESNRDDGWHQVYLAQAQEGRVSPPRRLSSLECDNYRPALARPSPDRDVVVWHSFRDNNFDLYAHDSAAEAEREKRLTAGPTIDREARLITARDGLWLAWENVNCAGYHIGAAKTKRVQIARLSASGLETPVGLGKTELWRRAEIADLALDPQGRLWVSARIPRGQHAGWDVIALCYSGGEWSEPLRVGARKGMCRRPWLGFAEGRVIVCYQGDNIPNSWATVDDTVKATSGIFAGVLAPSSAPAPAELMLEPYQDPADEFEAAAIRVARGEDTPPRSITYKGRRLNLYFGDLHEHTDVSVCNRTGDQTHDQSYESMRDIARYDFAGVTDHGYNFNAYLWTYAGKMARANNDPGRFLTFLAEEWTSTFEKYSDEHPYGYYGHRNLILEDPYFPMWFSARDSKTPSELWEILRREKANFVHIPHQLADTGNVPTDWNFVDEEAQPVAEIFQTRGSYEYEGAPRQARSTTPKGWFLQDAWARGIVIGVIASPDHGGGFGKAAVYAPELSRKAILDAMRARHTYGTTAAKIFLDVRVNGHLMGERGPAPGGKPVRVEITAACPGDIGRVEVCRNNEFVHSREVEGRECEFTFVDERPPDGPCYYYVRVMQKDGEIAWSSPVWLGPGEEANSQ